MIVFPRAARQVLSFSCSEICLLPWMPEVGYINIRQRSMFGAERTGKPAAWVAHVENKETSNISYTHLLCSYVIASVYFTNRRVM